MAFIVLDVEIIFLYPFTTVFRDFEPAEFGVDRSMGIFLLTLLVPFAYLLSTGALDWGPISKVAERAVPRVSAAPGQPGAGGLDPAQSAPPTESEAA